MSVPSPSSSSRPTAAGVLYLLSGVAALLSGVALALAALALTGSGAEGAAMALVFVGPVVLAAVLWLPLVLAAAGGAVHARRSARARRFSLVLSSASAVLFVLAAVAGAYYYGGFVSIVSALFLAAPFFVTGALSFAARPAA